MLMLMSIRLMSRVFDLRLSSVTTKMVLLVLADNANEQGFCWPSIATVARKSGLCERSVQHQLKLLEALTLVERTERNGHSSIYQLVLENPTPVDSPPQDVHPTPADCAPGGERGAPPGVNVVHPEPSVEPSIEPSKEPPVPPLPPKGGSGGLKVPDNLKEPEFLIAWGLWVAARKAMKKVKDWHSLFQGQLDWLSAYGPKVAKEMVEQSRRNGWIGVFEVHDANPDKLPKVVTPSVNPTTQAILHQKELDEVKSQMRVLNASYSEHQDWAEEDKQKWHRLKARKLELKQLLGMQV